jgi:virginiamycin A acetyltransferase
MFLKDFIKRYLLKYRKSIITDNSSKINYQVINESINKDYPVSIFSSICNFKVVNEGSRVSEARCYGDISLGRFVTITGPGTVINSIKEEIHIGNFSSIGQNVCIVDFNHSFERVTSSFINNKIFKEKIRDEVVTKGPVLLEEDVWIGSNSVIMPGVKIGRGSVIGAGSVVTRNIPKYSIAYGNPAVVISKRFDNDKIELLENLQWWDWNIKKIQKYKAFFKLNIKKTCFEEIEEILKGIN